MGWFDKTYSGNLDMLGSSIIKNNGTHKYSVIEIGRDSIKNVECSGYLANYLSMGLGKDITIETSIANRLKFLIAIFAAVGIFQSSIGSMGVVAFMVFMILFTGFIGSQKAKAIKSVTVDGKTYKD